MYIYLYIWTQPFGRMFHGDHLVRSRRILFRWLDLPSTLSFYWYNIVNFIALVHPWSDGLRFCRVEYRAFVCVLPFTVRGLHSHDGSRRLCDSLWTELPSTAVTSVCDLGPYARQYYHCSPHVGRSDGSLICLCICPPLVRVRPNVMKYVYSMWSFSGAFQTWCFHCCVNCTTTCEGGEHLMPEPTVSHCFTVLVTWPQSESWHLSAQCLVRQQVYVCALWRWQEDP